MSVDAPETFSLPLDTFLAVGVVFISLTTLMIIVRVVFNIHKTKHFLIEDVVAVIALAFLIAKFSVLYTSALADINPHTSIFRALQLTVAFHFIGSASMWTSKVSILLMLIRLFGSRLWVRVTSLVVIFTSLVAFLASVIVVGVACVPESEHTGRYINPNFLPQCLRRASAMSEMRGGVALALDVIIFVMPLPIIYKLSLPAQQKNGLFLVFTVEVFAIAAGASSLYFKIAADALSTTSAALIGTTIDCSIAIMVGCAPALYGAWLAYVNDSITTSKIPSMISSFLSSVKHKIYRLSPFEKFTNYESNESSRSQGHDGYWTRELPTAQQYRVWANDVSTDSTDPMSPRRSVTWKWERVPAREHRL
ncbi:hypothetical protein QBC38DRAFT_60075 [Podospora fimiseda]|uniref:Rhodopsin domain-containing protein n=1 Tax=Podospora fimiseda TaxID=252190 RepID=A0AAN7GNG8_9PEZI|nr:hypothetical protein QBC38DRAFT_60075 [Podospora fimiseda]